MIHFNEEASLGGQNYFDFFPQELLEGSPYKIRVIEHEDFIDYEIEFVEMSDEEEEKEEEEYQYEYYNEEEAFDPSPADAGLTSGKMISIEALHGIPHCCSQLLHFRLWNHVHGPAREGETAAPSDDKTSGEPEKGKTGRRIACPRSSPRGAGKVDRFPGFGTGFHHLGQV